MTPDIDRNKTHLTHVATATVAAWLDRLGCKPVETEVDLGGWIADVASFWQPTFTEAKAARLLKDLVPKGLNDHEAFVRMCRSIGGRLTVVVEVKTSRADFLRDVGRKISTHINRATLRPPAHMLVLAAPNSVVSDKDYLHQWARLQLSENCDRVVAFRGGWHANPLHPSEIEDLIAAVAIRRDHHTRYQSTRRFWRHYRLRKKAD